jgi:carbon monoxide dehydrogenase subunit G
MAMQMSGETVLPAPRERVWAALNDPDMLKACIPGCESFERTGDNSFKALVVTKLGPVKAKFKGNVELLDLDPPNGYRLAGQGDGGIAGFAKGGATVSLSDAEGGGTKLTYVAEGQIGGKLAQLGQRLVDGVAKSMADQFFGNFAKKLSEGAEAAA